MRLKSLPTTGATNQRIRTCVGNIFLLCLLSPEVWSLANVKQHRFVRQLDTETPVNYEDDTSTASLHHRPHFTANRTVIVQLFEWKFLDVAAECRNFLGPQGYAGVQLSPVLEHTVVQTSTLNHPWWERYEVISYRLASRSGDESEFWSMSRICNDHGVRIYADVVLNHMAAPLHLLVDDNEPDNKDFIVNTLLETNVNISELNYSNVSYTQVDFHRSPCVVRPHTQDAHEIRNCQLNGHPDLDHSRGGVQKHIVRMLNKFVDMGVAGFRVDTAKYIWPIDLKKIFQQVKNLSTEFNFKKGARPFLYHDVFDLGLDTVSKTEYSTYGVVSEYLYPAELATIFNRKVPLSSLINWGPALGFLPHEDSLVFIDSHDTQRGLPVQLGNNHMLTHKQRIKYIMANVFMLVHPYGAIKRIMSSYYYPDRDINQGPPVDDAEGEEIRSPKFNDRQQCTKESGWVCEHRWPQLLSMLKVANYFQVPGQQERSIIYFQTNGANQVAFCRGYKAFVAINNEAEMDFDKEVYACLEPGTYCDMVTGGKKEGEEKCHGKMVVINDRGYTKLNLAVADGQGGVYEQDNEVDDESEEESGRIESYGILVIYVESKIEPANGNGDDDKELKEQGVNDLNEQTHEVADNQTEEGTDLEETPDDDDDTQDNADQKNDEAEEEGEKQTSSTEQLEEVDPETAKEEVDAGENQPEVNEETEIEEAGDEPEDDANDTVQENNEETSNEQPEEEDEEGEGKKSTENEEDDKEDDAEEKAEGEEPNEDDAEQGNEEDSNNDETEKEVDAAEVIGNEELADNDEANEGEADVQNENDEQDIPSNDQPETEEAEQEPLATENSLEIVAGEASIEHQAENVVEEPEIETVTVEDKTEINQSRNLDEKASEPEEEQMEKPTAQIVGDVSDAADAVTAKVQQDVQKAGIFSKPKDGGNNG